MSEIVKQVRKIASRGRMDDADVQIIFDAADEIERLRALADAAADILDRDGGTRNERQTWLARYRKARDRER